MLDPIPQPEINFDEEEFEPKLLNKINLTIKNNNKIKEIYERFTKAEIIKIFIESDI